MSVWDSLCLATSWWIKLNELLEVPTLFPFLPQIYASRDRHNSEKFWPLPFSLRREIVMCPRELCHISNDRRTVDKTLSCSVYFVFRCQNTSQPRTDYDSLISSQYRRWSKCFLCANKTVRLDTSHYWRTILSLRHVASTDMAPTSPQPMKPRASMFVCGNCTGIPARQPIDRCWWLLQTIASLCLQHCDFEPRQQ